MSHIKLPPQQFMSGAHAFQRELAAMGRLPPDAAELMRMASQLGPRDLAALSCIIRRAGEICESDGEEVAMAVLDQIGAILDNRPPDA